MQNRELDVYLTLSSMWAAAWR